MNSSQNRFLWPVRVYYEDTDAGGVVYYANYLKFMERARTEWLRSKGFEQDELLQKDGIIFAVRHVDVGYHHPARFNDALEVSATVSRKGRASLTFYQEVVRAQDTHLLCQGEIKIACVNMKTMRPTPIPKHILLEIADVD
ncbi:MAG: tol-pal system-associated acyl-CoA thioesterase [Candidatus Thiodiazotropha lotti]|uniref:Tol-pal system-associated acyl-CoA thioesterase n=1 Tax=Candidatus Thiodiazotropha endoloripes TaxID=1818881 RepID=A0A1E2URP8_9GAMM|nr:tol-pal system-associated acyl-CoA thioesterase [Candidatus Thiodiazotropha endoloripes]MCG7898471.1 tol-pal system-associated acyl-CoA thioesterase [Candidatus Thiodiazotropha weberae]MCG7990286.1 tol-pal system-associated acyl-CoA thioesterase [Candidatus Thiodiazotropha lotti]MCG7902706.1 tol-pal system-associated acyl-CoA thioesterase [Candidatus Thiodiazotropha weberae]MCG7913383.1 tol-pal system-associated acyl-CoA thioesterase [Candidatus Thiodiazotropha weberae]MCG7999077.1 tol-pal 